MARHRSKPRSQTRSSPALACVLLASLASCATDRATRAPDRPIYESRTGVPILMDIPILGFFFSSRRIER